MTQSDALGNWSVRMVRCVDGAAEGLRKHEALRGIALFCVGVVRTATRRGFRPLIKCPSTMTPCRLLIR